MNAKPWRSDNAAVGAAGYPQNHQFSWVCAFIDWLASEFARRLPLAGPYGSVKT
ncbi:hypothetical protein [Afipia massiliensis]|uniref:hypothetical protein n=1 Tax=Afipia massiliensis TaxID=211460 RepID=UPI001484EFBC|nr:hypothetical protein [Afipia massiliensis]